jgi:hypothetical protein
MKVPEAVTAFSSAFINARQTKWGIDQLLEVLFDESQSLMQKLGIEQLKAQDFNQELARKQRRAAAETPKPTANAQAKAV